MSEHELWNELGNLYFMSGAYNQAANAYQRSIQSDTEFGRPYSNLALTYVQQGKYDDAIDLYRRSIELLADNTEKAISLNRLGNVYRHLKDYSRAVVAFQEADELDPHGTDEFPPAAPSRADTTPAPSSVLDEPVGDIIYDRVVTLTEVPADAAADAPVAELQLSEPVLMPIVELPGNETVDVPVEIVAEEPAAVVEEAPVIEIVEEPIAEAIKAPVAEAIEEPIVEAVEQPVAETIEEPVAAIAVETLDEVIDDPIAQVIDETCNAAIEEPVAELIDEAPAEMLEEPVAEAPAQPEIESLDERMTRRLGFLVTEALDQAIAAVADAPAVDSTEPETEPELEWWDVDEQRIETATHSEIASPDFTEDPSTWTPADLGQFQQDVSQMPDTGSLTTWGDAEIDDDFERWSPLDPAPDVETPDPDSDNFSTWLPMPEESPASFDELRVPPFVDELEEESEPPSGWEELAGPEKSDVTPVAQTSMRAVAPEMPVRNEAAVSQQKAWHPQVDVAVEERTLPQQRPSRVEVEPAPRTAQPDLVLAPAMQTAPAPQPEEPDRDAAEMRQIEMEIDKFRRVVQYNPRNARAWDALGTLYKSAGMYKDAIVAYQQAISTDPSKSLYYHHLGLVYACEHRDQDAITAFQRVIEIDPDYSLAHATLGGYYRKMGYEELAQKHIGKAMKNIFDSENEYNRACLEAICGNADQAIKLLDVALKNKQTYVDWILRDPDLDFIRQDPRFKQLISRYTR